MMKFKKFLAAAMTGAMMFGTVAMVTPVYSVYAAQYDYIITADKTEAVAGKETTINLSAGEEGTEAGVIDSDQTHQTTFTASDTSNVEVKNTTTAGEKAVVTIKDTVTAGTITITATRAGKTATINITIKEKEENPGPSTPTDKYALPDIDYETMTATITSNDPYVFLEIFKDPAKTEKASASYVFPTKEGKAVVDLGFYKATKPFGIKVYGTSNMAEKAKSDLVTVNAQPGKLSFKVNTSKPTFLESIEKGKEGRDSLTFTAENIVNYSYRSLYATAWDSLDSFDYETAKIAGTTIVVRKEATETAPAGPEAKIKIAASAKAPKVTVDYLKGTIKVTEKMEIALLGSTALVDTDYQQASKNMTIEQIAKNLKADSSQDYTIAIRTMKTDKKAASMPCFLTIKAVPALTAEGATATSENGTVTATTVENGVKLTKTGEANFQYDKSGKWVTIENDMVIASATSVKVRIAPVKADSKVPGSGSFASAEVTITPAASSEQKVPATVEVSMTEEEKAKFVAGGADSNALELALTVAVKDKDGAVVEGATVTVEVTKDGSPATGFSYASGKLTVASGTTLTASEAYVITVKCGEIASTPLTLTVQ
ncbi:MAG: hypothetical protein K2N63_03970 [Lachnospiraceae bacterium]|nr:hypothetical protein [Lachnospiraceae bacterium]